MNIQATLEVAVYICFEMDIIKIIEKFDPAKVLDTIGNFILKIVYSDSLYTTLFKIKFPIPFDSDITIKWYCPQKVENSRGDSNQER